MALVLDLNAGHGPADLILKAFASQRLVTLLSEGDPTLDEDRGYVIARGFTNRTIWRQCGVWAPTWGYVATHQPPLG